MKLVVDIDLSYPIIMTKGKLVMGGMHRVTKALMLGHETIPALIFKKTPKPDYIDVQPNDLPY